MRLPDDIIHILPHKSKCRMDLVDFLSCPTKEDRKKAIEEEMLAGFRLSDLGCTPCCFWDDDLDVKTPCDVFDNTIVGYWQSYFWGPRTHCMLQNQLKDWLRFQSYQNDRRCTFKGDVSLLRESLINERRDHESLDGDVPPLSLDPGEQSHTATWIEFQHYHVKMHERLRDGVKELEENLNEIKAEIRNLKPEDSNSEKAEKLYVLEDEGKEALDDARQSLRWHIVMENWIKEQLDIRRRGFGENGKHE